MISFLIPVYNFNITDFVKELHSQAEQAKKDFEIIVLDDNSWFDIKEINRTIRHLSYVIYKELDKNIGRSLIRNQLAQMAKYEFLVFMDCDSKIPNKGFVDKYLNECKEGAVVCGGRIYSRTAPDDRKFYLRWLYGVKREQLTVQERSRKTNKSFFSNNFLIHKNLYKQVGFNEEITGYGHEDTLFGYELKMKNVVITHIDNPLIHIGLETNNEFLDKTKKALNNLIYLYHRYRDDKNFIQDITLLSKYIHISRVRMGFLFKLQYILLGKIMEKHLLGKRPVLFIFDLYRLSYFCHNIRKLKPL